MNPQNLIEQYEARLKQLSYDQRTDDAMSSEAYEHTRDTLEGVIRDLKNQINEPSKQPDQTTIETFLTGLGLNKDEFLYGYRGPYSTIGVLVNNRSSIIQFVLRDGYFQELTCAGHD